MRSIWVLGIILCIFARSIRCSDDKFEFSSDGPLQVALTLIQSAEATGPVCLDGSLPGYHLHPGFGSGVNSWLIQLEAASLQFRGQRIWVAAMNELMSNGMKNATQALLSGCSAGGLASILHCDQFHDLFQENIRVKCLADAGFFLDAVNVAGGRTLRALYNGVVTLQGVSQNLAEYCTSRMDATLCFFPENLVANIRTPLFLLNAAYDVWQLQESLAPSRADPKGYWRSCKSNHANCNESQIQFLQDFRNEMIDSIKGFSLSEQNGWFINSCFAHCQTERQDTWFGTDSPVIANKTFRASLGRPTDYCASAERATKGNCTFCR